MRHLACMTLVVAAAASSVAAQEWARLRGPAGAGHGRADLPPTFTDEHVVWRVPIGGRGHSSPVLWGGHVYLTREVSGRRGEEEGIRELVCFDAVDGAELWSVADRFRPYHAHGFNSYASASVAVDADGIYLALATGPESGSEAGAPQECTLYAVSWTHDGELRWRRDVGPFHAMHGPGNSVVLAGDVLIVPNEHEGSASCIVALDTESGEERWRLERKSVVERATYALPALHRGPDGEPRLLVTSTGHGLTSLDPRTGVVDWELDLAFEQRVVAAGTVAGRHAIVYAGSGGAGKECAVIRLPASPDEQPVVAHRVRRSIPYVPCAIADAAGENLFLFADGGIAQCLDAASGDVHWRERMDGTFFSSPVLAGGVIYIADREGHLHSIRASTDFERLGRFELGAPVFATPAIALGSLFVRTDGELLRVGRSGG